MKCLGLPAVALLLLASPALAAAPRTMSYQGVLTNGTGTPVANGSYNLTFKLYDVATSGSALWTEAQNGVSVSNGEFSVILGSVTPLDTLLFDTQYWLGIAVGSDPELVPRVRLASAPYTLVPQPGISQGKFNGSVTITSTTTMADVVTTMITIPAAGYIVVDVSASGQFYGTIGSTATILYQIDETAGGPYLNDYYRLAGTDMLPNSSSLYVPAVAKRTYFKAAGTYTFRLEALKSGVGTSGTTLLFNPTITAAYFPTAHGTVTP